MTKNMLNLRAWNILMYNIFRTLEYLETSGKKRDEARKLFSLVVSNTVAYDYVYSACSLRKLLHEIFCLGFIKGC